VVVIVSSDNNNNDYVGEEKFFILKFHVVLTRFYLLKLIAVQTTTRQVSPNWQTLNSVLHL
jgi:hypothetical protein